MSRRVTTASVACCLFVATIGGSASGEAAPDPVGFQQRILAVDTHVDIPLDFASATHDPSGYTSAQFDLPKMRAGGIAATFLVVYTPQGTLDAEGIARARLMAEQRWQAIDRLVRSFPDEVALARSTRDVDRIRRSGRSAVLVGIENAYPLGHSVEDVARWAARGVKYVGITHVGDNQFGGSSSPGLASDGSQRGTSGLTELGRQLVTTLNRAGIMVDVSHASRETMMEAVALSVAPVIASHSSARAVTDSDRNLDDDQLRALAARGGVAQMVAHASFIGRPNPERKKALEAARSEIGLGDAQAMASATPEQRARLVEVTARVDARYPRATVAEFVDHVDHAVAVAGIDHVGIASDFDGGGGIAGWMDQSESPAVTAELLRRGYGEDQIRKLWGGNILRVMTEVDRVGARLRRGDASDAAQTAFATGKAGHDSAN